MKNKERPSKNQEKNKRSANRGRDKLPALLRICGTMIFLSIIIISIPMALPRFSSIHVYNVVSGSMEPKIPVGSFVLTLPIAPEEVQDGEVIAYLGGPDESVVTHRVVHNRYVEGEFVTKGDANPQEDLNPIPYSAYLGTMRIHVPYIGAIMEYSVTSIGRIYMILYAACGVLFHLVAYRIEKEKKRGDISHG